MWFPKSIFLIYHKVNQRSPENLKVDKCTINCTHDNSAAEKPVPTPNYFGVITIASTVIIILHPLINLHLNEDLSNTRWWQFKYYSERKNNSSKKQDAGSELKREAADPETSGERRLSNFAPSSFEMRSTMAVMSVDDNSENEAFRLEQVKPELNSQEDVSSINSSSSERHVDETFV